MKEIKKRKKKKKKEYQREKQKRWVRDIIGIGRGGYIKMGEKVTYTFKIFNQGYFWKLCGCENNKNKNFGKVWLQKNDDKRKKKVETDSP